MATRPQSRPRAPLASPQMLQHYNRVVTTKLITMLKHNVDMAGPCVHSVCFERIARYIDE